MFTGKQGIRLRIGAWTAALPGIWLLAATVCADVRLPRLLSDGVVLQRDSATRLHGWADPDEIVEIRLDGEVVAEVAATDGHWLATLRPKAAGGPHRLEFKGGNHVVVETVYFGDVWLASGQSNMELPMTRVRDEYADEIASADDPLLRHFTVPKDYDFAAPRADLPSGEWLRTTPSSIENLSAVGYFFARNLRRQHDVPIGIIVSAYGGSGAESWMSEAALAAYPHYLDIAKSYRDEDYLQSLIDTDQVRAQEWHGQLDAADPGLNAEQPWFEPQLDDGAWPEVTVPGFFAGELAGTGSTWLRRSFELPDSYAGEAAILKMGRIKDADTTWVNGKQVGGITYEWPPRRFVIEPGVLRPGKNTIVIRVVANNEGDAGPVPDKAYTLRYGRESIDLSGPWKAKTGARQQPISPLKFAHWVQPLGIYNAMLAPLLNTTIKGVIWYQGETNVDRAAEYVSLFPAMIRNWRADFDQGNFPFLFVQLANYLEPASKPVHSEWARLRDAQTQALQEANTAMAVAIDVVEWNDIHPLDKKTVAERLALAARSVAYNEQDLVHSGPRFRQASLDDGKVLISFDSVGDGLRYRGDKLGGFAVAGKDGHFAWADANIVDDRVVLRSESVSHPVTVRYAWADNPVNANLYNAEDLPAVPFEGQVESVDATPEE
jgi:sialate O-acetylesterase